MVAEIEEGSQIQQTKIWDDPKKQKRLEKLLMQMETILAESNDMTIKEILLAEIEL